MTQLQKIIAIVGATASGKTGLGIKLAKTFNGEVISADSRQIYTKMDVGTGKPHGEWKRRGFSKVWMVDGVPHHMMSIVDPGTNFTLANFKEQAMKIIEDILKRGKLPILVGGTGLYIWAIVDNLAIPKLAPNKKLRKSLETKSAKALAEWLKKIDPETYKQIDIQNPRRVMRALEVAILTGESIIEQQKKMPPLYDVLQIGIQHEPEELERRMDERVQSQMAEGLVDEAKALMKQKYGWQLPSMSSIGYKQMRWYLEGECTLPEAVASFKRDTRRYARRQLTWFKRDKRIQWIHGDDAAEATRLVQDFLQG